MRIWVLLVLTLSASAQTTVTGTMLLPTTGDTVNGRCTYQTVGGVPPTTARALTVPVTVAFGQPTFARGHLQVQLVPGGVYEVTCTAPAQTTNNHQTQLHTWRWVWVVPTNSSALDISQVIVPHTTLPIPQVTWNQIEADAAVYGLLPWTTVWSLIEGL